MLRALLGTTVIGGAMFAAAAGSPAMAQAASPQAPSSITLLASDPALGSLVHFANTYPNGTKNPGDSVACYQNGTVVWSEILSISQAQQYGFKLGGDSSPWLTNGGSATCTAELISVDFKPSGETITVLANDPFVAAA